MKSLFVFLLISFSTSLFAQSSARFTITRGVIAGGGTTPSTSSRFQLSGTVGQPLAAVPSSSQFSIQGGFWIWTAPIIFASANAGSNFVFSFQSEPGKTYQVIYSDSLSNPSWQNLISIGGNGALKSVTNSEPGIPQRFFRLIEH